MGSCKIIRTLPFFSWNPYCSDIASVPNDSFLFLGKPTGNDDVPRRQLQGSANFLGKWASVDLAPRMPNCSLHDGPQRLPCIIPNWKERESFLRRELVFESSVSSLGKNLSGSKGSSSGEIIVPEESSCWDTMESMGHRKLGFTPRSEVLRWFDSCLDSESSYDDSLSHA